MSYGKAIWDDWFIIAGPLNKLAGWLTIVLAVLWWALAPVTVTGYLSIILAQNAWRLVCGVLAGFFYLTILQKPIDQRDLSKNTHIWLLICFGLSLFAFGVFIWVEFLLVGCLSEAPFWRAFSQGSIRYY